MSHNAFNTLPPGDQAVLWQPRRLDGVSLFKARFNRFAYKPHCHSEFAIGVIEQGVQRFSHRGQTYTAPADTIICVNPDEAHDGMAGTSAGYQYRMAYISEQKLLDIISCDAELPVRPGYFKRPRVVDHQVAPLLHRALVLLDDGDRNSLESHTCFAQALTRLFLRHGTRSRHPGRGHKDNRVVARAVEFIKERAVENITLEEIAGAVGLSQYHFLRIFKDTTGLPPHAYLIQIRVALAKKSIQEGVSLVETAQNSGFSDQSHMSRCFKAINGVTPGKYRKMILS